MELKRKYELLDSESIFECPLCMELLSPPVYQCENGHIACTACRAKLRREECPYCRSKKVAHSRNLAVEKILECLLTSCKHNPQGCKAMLKIADREKHENDLCGYQFGVPGRIGARKKRIKVDRWTGLPSGPEPRDFLADVKEYANDLDPRVGWDKQPSNLKDRFFERMYTDWEVLSSCKKVKKVSEKFFKPHITKALINRRYRINRLIDMRGPRPAELETKYWDNMVTCRMIDTPDMMKFCSSVVSRLALRSGKAPLSAEVDAEMVKEYNRQCERRGIRAC